jgi:hypothetical protein
VSQARRWIRKEGVKSVETRTASSRSPEKSHRSQSYCISRSIFMMVENVLESSVSVPELTNRFLIKPSKVPYINLLTVIIPKVITLNHMYAVMLPTP